MHSAGCPVQQRGEVAGHRACSLNRNSSGFTAVPPQNVLALPPVLGAAIALWRVYRTYCEGAKNYDSHASSCHEPAAPHRHRRCAARTPEGRRLRAFSFEMLVLITASARRPTWHNSNRHPKQTFRQHRKLIMCAMPLIPVQVDEIMLPGDERELSLHSALIANAMESDDCMAMLPLVVGSTSSESKMVHTVAEWMPLLRVKDVAVSSSVVNFGRVRLLCIGRVRLRCSDGLYVLPDGGSHQEPAPVTRYADDPLSVYELAAAGERVHEIESLRESCISLDAKLKQTKSAPALLSPSILERSLATKTDALHDQLLHACSVDELRERWAVGSDVRGDLARRMQVASFAASGWFGPRTRAYAAQCQSTVQRLELARDALKQREQWGQAMLAVELALGRSGAPRPVPRGDGQS